MNSKRDIFWDGYKNFTEYLFYQNGDVYSKKKDRFLKPTKDTYLRIALTDKGRTTNFYLHRVIAELFVPNPNNKPQVNHKDGNKLNPHYLNLEWCTGKENIVHAFKNGLSKIPNNRPCLSVAIIQKTLSGLFIKEYPSANEAGRQIKVSATSIRAAANGGREAVIRGVRKWEKCTQSGGFKWEWKQN